MRKVNNGRRQRQFRADEAKERDSARRERSPQQQLALLDQRLGEGNGAERERARLLRLINAPAKTPKGEKKKNRGKKKQLPAKSTPESHGTDKQTA